MRSAIMAAVCALWIGGCAGVEEGDTSSEQALDEPAFAPGGAAPSTISEQTYWRCDPAPHLYVFQSDCQAACSHACRPRTICVSGSGQVPCP